MAEAVLRAKIEEYHDAYVPLGIKTDLRMLGAARLSGQRFELDLFSATWGHRVANVVESNDQDEVWGALYDLPLELVRRSDKTRSLLDRIEGHLTTKDPANYKPLQVVVEQGDERIGAWTYVGLDEARERCAQKHRDAGVSTEYAGAVLDGARSVGLPPTYIAQLEAVIAEHTRPA